MAFTLAYAIGGSMILALTAIPVFMTIIYRKYFESSNPGKLEWHNPIYEWIAVYYEKAIANLKNHSVTTVVTAITLVVVVVFVGYKNIGTEFLPDLDEGSINIRCFLPVGISLDEANKYMPLIRKVIAKNKPVNLVITQLGRNDDGTDPYGPNRLEILVGLNEYSSWIKNESKEELLKKIKYDLEQAVPGALFSFSQPILDNVTEAVTGSVADLAVLISGDDLKFMRKEADSVLTVIKNVQGASEFGIEQEGDQAQLSVDINRNACARFGVNVSDIQRMIEAAIGGRTVSRLYEGSKRFDIVVRYTPEYRSSIEAVKNLQVNSVSGGRIPLRQLASISLLDGPTIIQRENDKRQISVRTNIRGRDQGGFVKEAQDSVDKKIHLPKGYTIDWGDNLKISREQNKDLRLLSRLLLQ